MRLYVVFCRKCGKFVSESVTVADNVSEACGLQHDHIARHDLTCDPDGTWPDFDVIRFIPTRIPKRKRK